MRVRKGGKKKEKENRERGGKGKEKRKGKRKASIHVRTSNCNQHFRVPSTNNKVKPRVSFDDVNVPQRW